MVECLKEMLALDMQRPMYTIMDALDECPITSTIPSPREEVLELVDELLGLHLPASIRYAMFSTVVTYVDSLVGFQAGCWDK